MNTDSLKIKYLLSEGVNIKSTNIYVDNSIIDNRAKDCENLLVNSQVVKGHIKYYINPNKFVFETIAGDIDVESSKSIHLPEGKSSLLLLVPKENQKAKIEFNLLYYDRI